jgi:hypothetical protein
MYATNRKSPDRRDPANSRMEYPHRITNAEQLQATRPTRSRNARQHTILIGTDKPLEPPQSRGKAPNHKFRLWRLIQVERPARPSTAMARKANNLLCAYSTLEAEP